MTHTHFFNKISSLEIQGAQNVAKDSILFFREFIKQYDVNSTEDFLKQAKKLSKNLIQIRPTEPFLRNCFTYLFFDLKRESTILIMKSLLIKINYILDHINESDKIIQEIGSKKIKKGSIVYTHCHSSTVMRILKKARQQGKKFEVHLTETRPKLQGRISAKELLDCDIPVTMYVDSAARLAIKKADIAFFGCDAITTSRVFNKIGTEMFCEIAHKYDVPIYFCTNSWKFDPETIYGAEEPIEERKKDEVWKDAPKKLKIINYAFEKINPLLITGIISELGIFKHQMFLEELKAKHSWIFKIRK